MTATTPVPESTWRTLRRGLALSPELGRGLAGTLVLAILMTGGRAAVPVAIQHGIDHGLRAAGGPDLGVISTVGVVTAAVLTLGVLSGYLMMRRLFRVSETALAAVRVRVFRHIHRLSMLDVQSHQRGGLVARATSDVDQITSFLQWNGVVLLICIGQTLVITVVMFFYSWPLALAVLVVFLPVVWVVRACMRRLAVAYSAVRQASATMLSAISESVVGAEVIRAYDVSSRTEARLDQAVDDYRSRAQHAARLTVTAYSAGELAAGLALAVTTVLGVWLGIGGRMTVGEITAFLFLVTMFAMPAQVAGEMLNEMQNAVAGWRRVLDVLDLTPSVSEPAEPVDLPPGPVDVTLVDVCFTYPGTSQMVLRHVTLDIAARTRVAIVGETGAGKTTLAKLVTRLVDPTHGQVRLSGVPLDQVGSASLRRRVVMVPQDGFLFQGTIFDNVRFGQPLSDGHIARVFTELGLADWVLSLPDGLNTGVGERGEGLSVGERQLVALARAHAAEADLLVLDEATSSVDAATEVRLRQALEAASRGRTTITIAHRLATARDADDIIVIDAGRVIQRGRHQDLLADPTSPYATLHTASQL